MTFFVFLLSLAVLLATIASLLEIVIGCRKIGLLRDVDPMLSGKPPKVSIIFSASDEAEGIEPAVRSMLSITYPDYEIIAIDDRSDDATGDILDRLAAAHPNLRVLHIHELPSGWLGKTHALNEGTRLAGGDYFLFTDADIVFDPSSVARAVAYCERDNLDHLTLILQVVAKSHLLRMFLLKIGTGFSAQFKPWKIRSSPKHYLGIGGFNMVRRAAYQSIGGHAALPMAVLDDMTLGRFIKVKGFQQDVLYGYGMVRVEWYRTAIDLLKGLRKNTFTNLDYSIGKLVITTLLFFLMAIWPWIGLIATGGATWWINATTVMSVLAFYLSASYLSGWSPGCLVFEPIVTVSLLVFIWYSCVSTMVRGEVEWRGTRYSLTELKAKHWVS